MNGLRRRLVLSVKQEIGVDSQLLLAQQQVNGVMGVLVDVLRAEPHLLNAIEMQVAALKMPTYVQDADWEVLP